jgi:arylsulfatase A-like enzyme
MAPSPPEDVENILFLFTDQQRRDSIDAYGCDAVDVETPNLDRLAGEGVAYERAYTPTAICAPARTAVVTGERPHKNGVTRNPEERETVPGDCEFYPQLLRDAGYNVGLTGKWHLGSHPEKFGFDGEHYTGWWMPLKNHDYLSYLDERDLPHFDMEAVRDTFPRGDTSFQSGGIDDRPVEASFTYYLAEQAMEQLRDYAADDRPFYQSVHFFGPHNPYYLPEKYFTMYDRADVSLPESAIRETFENKPESHKAQRLDFLETADWRHIIAAYHGWVTFIDDQVGRILDELDRLGLADSTAVFFSSDHGGFVSAHKSHDKGPAMYEDIYNVPLIARNIGQTGHDQEHFVSLLDLAPTFLDIADHPVPSQWDGRSLFDVGNEDWRTDITAEFHGHKYAYEQRMLRTDRYKLVINEADTAELYDLEEDPHELNNCIKNPEYGDVSKRLFDRLSARLAESGDKLPDSVRTKVSAIEDAWSPDSP